MICLTDEEILDEIAYTLEVLRHEEDVTELRILNTRHGTISGYFSEMSLLAESAQEYDGSVPGIYVTINPVKPELIARANNRVIHHAEQTTSDEDIERRMWLPIDFDPVRSSGISSTEEEHQAALELATQVSDFLSHLEWPEPILADSGNGAHLLYYIDLPNDNTSTKLVKNVLEYLDFKFSNQHVQIDTTTYNASRIFKLYGTLSCKGEDTDDRPYRRSSILQVPEDIIGVSREVMHEFVQNSIPTAKPMKKSNAGEPTSFDLKTWLNKHQIKIASEGRWNGNATKYILHMCPWNDNHQNKSAYVVQFDEGGISAGCHHNSCSKENWHTLRGKYEPDAEQENISKDLTDKEKYADTLIRLGCQAELFHNDLEESFAAIQLQDHTEIWKLKSKKFKNWLIHKFYNEQGTAPKNEWITQALSVLEMKASFEGKNHNLQLRVADHEGAFYYDLADQQWRVVRITPEGCSLVRPKQMLFYRNNNMNQQVVPDFQGDLQLLLKHIKISDEQDIILLLVYIVTCLIPNIPHPVMVFFGEKGASKSTTMQMLRSIVDPAYCDLLTMPTGKQDLAIILSNNYMPSFDNLDYLNAEKCDLLCVAVTGGAFSKRTLYTDDDETILSFKRPITLNGINIVATRADLLDRSILLELERIDVTERKEERLVWEAFEADKPQILGGAFSALSKAMNIYPTLELEKLGRMADFTRWGYAIAEALGYSGDQFIEAYLHNQEKANDEAISANPVPAAIIALMKKQVQPWTGTVSELLNALEKVAWDEKINTNMKIWPKAAHVLSRRLNEYKSNLLQVGISFEIRHAGHAKRVTLRNENGYKKSTQINRSYGNGRKLDL